MADGALIVLAVLPGRSGTGKRRSEGPAADGAQATQESHTGIHWIPVPAAPAAPAPSRATEPDRSPGQAGSGRG